MEPLPIQRYIQHTNCYFKDLLLMKLHHKDRKFKRLLWSDPARGVYCGPTRRVGESRGESGAQWHRTFPGDQIQLRSYQGKISTFFEVSLFRKFWFHYQKTIIA